MNIFMTGFCPALSLRGAKRRGNPYPKRCDFLSVSVGSTCMKGTGLPEGELPHKEAYGLPHQSADWFAMTYENGSWVRGKRGHPGVRQCTHWLAHPPAGGRPRAQPSEARFFARRNDSIFRTLARNLQLLIYPDHQNWNL